MADTQTASAAKPARNTVWVENKFPSGITIFLSEEGVDEQSGKKIYVPIDETRVVLNGANSSLVVGGYGLTEVSADFWEAWMKQVGHKYPAVKNGVLKAQPTRERAMAQAYDEAKLETKLEPLDPDNPGEGLQKVPPSELGKAA